jgi:Na+-transporting NADH:ubiquinone oxidoreductase subunit C
MDTNNNLYTIIYATVMVVVVAVILAFAASLLKERQQRNVEIERKQMILRSVHLAQEASEAPDKNSYIEEQYAQFITDSSITADGEEKVLYVCNKRDGNTFYIIPMEGTGLWGPVWGYISLEEDYNTVHGAVFDHKSETPGLGAEITTPAFYEQFAGKQIFDQSGNFLSISIVKGGAREGNPHEVDAISGGTITSQAVEEMIRKDIGEYLNFFKTNLENK